ncbi:MAG: hypothetical protein D6717_06855 [Gammaproteobacteria bacterium]|nr:MAG: hypothetical protein D6717_06855 [Gammaproteobacteria bacterium]
MTAGFGSQSAGRKYNRGKRQWAKAKKAAAAAEQIMDAAMVASQMPEPDVPNPPKAGAEQFDFSRRRAMGDGLSPSPEDEDDEALVLGGDDIILQLAAARSRNILDG